MRRFPPPWSVEETDVCFIVRDANGQALAYVHFRAVQGSHRINFKLRFPLKQTWSAQTIVRRVGP